MRKIRMPSPAMIVAIVALVAALAGTAVASGVLTNKKFKKQAVRGPITYATTTITVPPAVGGRSYVAVAVACPSGFKVIGGGIKIPDPDAAASVYISDSYPTATGWAGHLGNYQTPNVATTATTTAICARGNSTSGSPPAS
jgi:hypothetical protein